MLLQLQTSAAASVHHRAGKTCRPFKHRIYATGVKICWACLSAMKETKETFTLREHNHKVTGG